MTYAETMKTLEARRGRIIGLQAELRALQTTVEPEPVPDYDVAGWDGPVRLSALFGNKPDLILIHNMGVQCASCTMWADGFTGVYEHLASRAALVVASPDPVETQQRVAAARGWRFRMVSYAAGPMAAELGYRDPAESRHGGWDAGVSVFRREGERLLRVSDTRFHELDDFCVVYQLYDLIPGADPAWEPATPRLAEPA